MGKSKKKQRTPSTVTVKRVKWADGYHSVARDSNGRFLATRKWVDKSSTEEVVKIVEEKIRTEAEKPAPSPAPSGAPVVVEGPYMPWTEKAQEVFPEYDITLKVITSKGHEWFVIWQSFKKKLTSLDLAVIKTKLKKMYNPKSSNKVYDEMIKDVIPICCRDASGHKEYF